MSNPSRLIIVDLSNFIFRAYFAIQRPMHAPDGTPTKAVYGVMNMMLKILTDYKPTHFFLARDTKGGSFRNELFEAYKANRTEPPLDLIPQFPIIEKLIQLMNFKNLALEKYEADDIIGSACQQWKNQFDEIYIASGDKDLMQFVEGNINLLDTMKNKLYFAKDVEEKMGVLPTQIVDFLSIVGDASDNIPGMKGIGAVGAAKLLKEFGSFDAIIENKHLLSGKKNIDAFNEHLEMGLLSRKLVTINTELNLGIEPKDLEFSFYPSEELIEFAKNLGFNSSVIKFQELQYQHHMQKENSNTVYVEKKINLQSQLFPKEKAFEIEVVALNETNFEEVFVKVNLVNKVSTQIIYDSEDIISKKVKEIYFSINSKEVYFSNSDSSFLNKCLKNLWGNSQLQISSLNIKNDYVYNLVNEIEIKANYFDIGIAHFNIDAGKRHDIKAISEEYLGKKLSEEVEDLNAEIAIVLWSLTDVFYEKLKSENLLNVYKDIDLKSIPPLARMEINGIRLNANFLLDFEKELAFEIKKVEQKIFEISGIVEGEINLNSPKQVGVLLFEKLKLPIQKKTKTGQSTDSEVLEELASLKISEVPSLLLTYREYGKILSTYVKTLPELVNPISKRIHTHFNLIIAQTGRLSSTNPNLQNIPIKSAMGKKVRKAFIASPGKILLSADYSQVELRLLAHFSEDKTMLKSFQENLDIHSQTASEVLSIPLDKVSSNDRSIAKTVNFGLMYGQSSFGLASTLNISRNEAKEYIEKYFERFNSIKIFLDTLKDKAEQTGYCETLHGRKRPLNDINSQNRNIKAQAERMAINGPIQGTASDIIKLAMIKIDQLLIEKKLKSKLLLQIHDELILEVEEEELEIVKQLVIDSMENVVDLKIPLRVDTSIGVNWFDL